MDRGYVDFERLFVFTLSAAFFVVRKKSNILLQRRYSHTVDKTTGVRSDHTVILTAIVRMALGTRPADILLLILMGAARLILIVALW